MWVNPLLCKAMNTNSSSWPFIFLSRLSVSPFFLLPHGTTSTTLVLSFYATTLGEMTRPFSPTLPWHLSRLGSTNKRDLRWETIPFEFVLKLDTSQMPTRRAWATPNHFLSWIQSTTNLKTRHTNKTEPGRRTQLAPRNQRYKKSVQVLADDFPPCFIVFHHTNEVQCNNCISINPIYTISLRYNCISETHIKPSFHHHACIALLPQFSGTK